MKHSFTLATLLLFYLLVPAQQCTTGSFDVCTGNKSVTGNFINATLIPGTGNALMAGAKYKYEYAIPFLNLDAVLSIDDVVNVAIVKLDDDNTTAGGIQQPSMFAPQIMPAQKLGCTASTGYAEFTIKFYTHYNGTVLPPAGAEIAVAGLHLFNYDMDGFTTGNDGWVRELHSVKMSGADPANYYAPGTELQAANFTPGWILAYGSTKERTGLAYCDEVTEKTIYSNPQTGISFRLGYDFKAPSTGCNAALQPTRDYAVRMGCFYLPAAGPLPVSLINFNGSNITGKNVLRWTSLQEHDVTSYEIQRSIDGTNYEVAGNVKANGLTSEQQYSFTDPETSLAAKNVYYRIRIVDVEHSMKLTNTVIIKAVSSKAAVMTVFPNPSNDNTQLRITVQKAGQGVVTITDVAGSLVSTQQVTLLQGNNILPLNNTQKLSEGYYTITLAVNNETYTARLLIWK
ncbi:MAG: T9SS type A sorting domain-containing protein [Bacteroidetes bacterium]|nr:T9SS type A sorting domain-containing protein [Bacteroidota bacterium]